MPPHFYLPPASLAFSDVRAVYFAGAGRGRPVKTTVKSRDDALLQVIKNPKSSKAEKEEAMNTLCDHYLKYIQVFLNKCHIGENHPRYDEYYGECTIALVKAIENFDFAENRAFSTLVTTYLENARNKVYYYLNAEKRRDDQYTVSLNQRRPGKKDDQQPLSSVIEAPNPYNMDDYLDGGTMLRRLQYYPRDIQRMVRLFLGTDGTRLASGEVARIFGRSKQGIINIVNRTLEHLKFTDTPHKAPQMPGRSRVIQKMAGETVQQNLDLLSEREQTMLKMEFGLTYPPMRLHHIARFFEISEDQAKQEIRLAARKIKSKILREKRLLDRSLFEGQSSLMAGLTQTQRTMIALRYGLNEEGKTHSIEAIAHQLGLPSQTVKLELRRLKYRFKRKATQAKTLKRVKDYRRLIQAHADKIRTLPGEHQAIARFVLEGEQGHLPQTAQDIARHFGFAHLNKVSRRLQKIVDVLGGSAHVGYRPKKSVMAEKAQFLKHRHLLTRLSPDEQKIVLVYYTLNQPEAFPKSAQDTAKHLNISIRSVRLTIKKARRLLPNPSGKPLQMTAQEKRTQALFQSRPDLIARMPRLVQNILIDRYDLNNTGQFKTRDQVAAQYDLSINDMDYILRTATRYVKEGGTKPFSIFKRSTKLNLDEDPPHSKTTTTL